MIATATTAVRPLRQRRWLQIFVVAMVLLALAGAFGTVAFVRYLATPRFISNGTAMAPCFGDRLRLTTSLLSDNDRRALRHGDIVVFDPPVTTTNRVIKRIVALGGDQIAIRDGWLFRNGTALEEPYVAQPALYRFPRTGDDIYTVPAGTVFVLGDNRNNSQDSHIYGAVALGSVTHKVTTPCTGQP